MFFVIIFNTIHELFEYFSHHFLHKYFNFIIKIIIKYLIDKEEAKEIEEDNNGGM